MPDNVNKLRNPDFTTGRSRPSGWTWTADDPDASWERSSPTARDTASGITIRTPPSTTSAAWSQTAVCKPGSFYRIEATIRCDLQPQAADDDEAGFVLSAEPLADGRPAGPRRVTPGLLHADQPTDVRAYYQVPEGIRRVRVSVGIASATGTATVSCVRCIIILEPDETSHELAIPPPAHTQPPPRRVQRVCVCSQTAEDRPLTAVLRAHFGDSNVVTAAPDASRASWPQADALLLPDATPPRSIRSITGLVRLASQRVVVISLSAFARLSDGAATVRRIEQDDDPIHARVSFANHATRGFALRDTFPYAWPSGRPGGFAQHQFRRTPEFKAMVKKHGFVTLLESMCDRDATSEKPICLYEETAGGGLFVLDLDPVEAPSSTFGEVTIAAHLLLSILGQQQSGLGMFVSPVRSERLVRLMMRDLADRFDPFVVYDADVPADEVTDQLITIGTEDRSFGLPLQSKPVILVRTGLVPADAESLYGALAWFKQLIRMEPHVCPYARALTSHFRLAWVPLSATWEPRDGWRLPAWQIEQRTTIDQQDGEVAALIDIVSRPRNRLRVLFPKEDAAYRRCAAWLPPLMREFTPARSLAFTVPAGAAFNDRRLYAWRDDRPELSVEVSESTFRDDAHQDVLTGGGTVIRLEIPGHDADFVAHSIPRTDLTATLLEHVIGLQYGLIAVNRRSTPVRFDALPPVESGGALVIDHRDPVLSDRASQAG
ncbi:MAG: hypothetical protein ACE5EX_07325 [Phycisphaerae bacterium]